MEKVVVEMVVDVEKVVVEMVVDVESGGERKEERERSGERQMEP